MRDDLIEPLIALLIVVICIFALGLGISTKSALAFGPIPKPDQCISVNALINRNCAPVYMCNGTPETNADWCCSTTKRWLTEEQKLLRWYKRNCENAVRP